MLTCAFENGNINSLRHVCTNTLVLKNDQILLEKRAERFLEGGKWGLPGGFMERDENVFQAAEREVKEETGFDVKDLKLFAIFTHPDRPNEDRQNVVFFFTAQAGEKTGEPDDESQEQKWFSLDELPPDDQIAFDFADVINLYKRYQTSKFPLPVVK